MMMKIGARSYLRFRIFLSHIKILDTLRGCVSTYRFLKNVERYEYFLLFVCYNLNYVLHNFVTRMV